ncbi:hypothetical protein Pcar_0042 [Syntrophotalea carbinolica DSM 2380]|uniref:Uncharacterized protein n=1 Tax=Syntrophotalea carbinolica (strain DSM 2380 / NBRC 103641 / GraBd1) TaxID=338963 RepID=Q3A8I7_SYNC1|nr:hypothetical protein [Syntrophotalea carbinolica]ABA87305.1 hypothetical protein Pcar_0042 [Syntrophotalea carbinolica DSM 2380]
MVHQSQRDLFAELAMSYVPHLAGLVDRNPYSRTYGCFDREYWHYRTRDFACGMSQEFVLPFALLYAQKCPGNRWFGLERMRELAVAGMHFARRASHDDGTCDDYFPWERAMGALAFSTYAATEAYQILGLDDKQLLEFFCRRGEHLLRHNESGRLSNHQALAALTLYSIYLLSGDERFRRGAQQRVELVLSWQHPQEGWFQEYEGADPGYQTCSIDFLAKYWRKSGDDALLGSLRKAVEFCALFMHPDGSYGGEYGSRNTYHYYPHGFELLAPHIPLAAQLNDAWLAGAGRGKRYHNDDDRMLGHLAYNWLQAWQDYCPRRPAASLHARSDFVQWLPDAGLAVVKEHGHYLVAGMKKGGVFKYYDEKGCLASDTGLIGELPDGRVVVSHLQDEHHAVEAQPAQGVFRVKGVLAVRSQKLASPFKQILFRMLNMSLGRFFPNLLRGLLQKLLITGKQRTDVVFERVLECADGRLRVTDRLPAATGFRRLSAGSDATSIYVAASNVYQESTLACPWMDAPDRMRLQGGEWVREFSRKEEAHD